MFKVKENGKCVPMSVTKKQRAMPSKEKSLQPEQVLAVLRLKFYEYYLRNGGKENVKDFEIWLCQQDKLMRVLNSVEEKMFDLAGVVV